MLEPKWSVMTISPYVAGKRQAEGFANPAKMSANENPLGSSDAARAVFAAASQRLHLYPDPRATVLRTAIAEKFALEPERLIFGCGSDELFFLLSLAFVRPGDNVVQPRYGFTSYRIAAAACAAEMRYADELNLTVDVDALLRSVDYKTRIVFVANPGNPTGTWIGGKDIRRLQAGLPEDTVLVLDSAYAEFAGDPAYEDGLALARESGNVLVTRTFSKLHGLAALRIGWGYGAPAIIDGMDRIRSPFNASVPAQEAAVAALADEAFQQRSIAFVEGWRPRLAKGLEALGCQVFPSATNFVLARFPTAPGRTAAEAEAYLTRHGILVRGLANYGLDDCLRISIGTDAENAAVLEALGAFFKAAEAPVPA